MSHSPNTGSGRSREPISSTSTTLLERVKAQDPEAWQRLVHLYGPLVYAWCRQCRLQPEDAADVAQEVFGAVAVHVTEFRRDRPGDTFRGWLWTVTRNRVRDHFRRQQRRLRTAGGADVQQLLAQVPDRAPGSSERSGQLGADSAMVLRALAAIRERFEDHTWQAFWRTTVERHSGADVAADLGMSVPAVYQAKYRVLRRIREDLGDLLE